VRGNLLVAGGFRGELICKFLDREGISYCCKSTHDDNGITNSLEIFEKPSGSVHFLASNNDCGVRDFDMEKFQICNNFRFPWAVNVSLYFIHQTVYIYILFYLLDTPKS
jgi:hypothetical protein